ncbi:hypothetical protein BGZ96_010122 [Linnemannia gamsii]|uniref:FAD-binding domain-containing protein n=1 Tax=Linnemannia gamsii TaxID=64522 RepID=A0ABQ7JUU7_9FUNG|nr:hypothetical protein BGZ96_010122 [Linnemannia gamsii]
MSMKVLSFQQNYEGVMLRFSDNTTLHGDILVGADGTTGPPDPAKYPTLLDPACENSFMNGDGSTPYTWVTFTVPGNRICWNVIVQLALDDVEDDQFMTSDWAPQQNKKMLESIRHFKTPYGTMGDLFDESPVEGISKVYYEDMLFETWTHGRTVLIGDAAHKLLPSTGQGAVNAMQDAVILANCLYDIKPTSFENIKVALKEYRDQRCDLVKVQLTSMLLCPGYRYVK